MTEKYTIYTLIDITNSKNTNSKSKNIKEYNQQQNLNTMIQIIGLRSQPIQYDSLVLNAQDLAQYQFGNQFKGLHTVWEFQFVTEHSQVYEKDQDPVYFLKDDFDGGAFTPYLDDTVNFLSPTFETKNLDLRNIYFNKLVI